MRPTSSASRSGPDGSSQGFAPGGVYIDMSTIDPATTQRDRRGRWPRRAPAMIDSPVGKTAEHAVAGTLTLMVGGDADVDRSACARSSTAWAPISSTAASSAPARR